MHRPNDAWNVANLNRQLRASPFAGSATPTCDKCAAVGGASPTDQKPLRARPPSQRVRGPLQPSSQQNLADPLPVTPLPGERHDKPRSGERLTGAGRSVDY